MSISMVLWQVFEVCWPLNLRPYWSSWPRLYLLFNQCYVIYAYRIPELRVRIISRQCQLFQWKKYRLILTQIFYTSPSELPTEPKSTTFTFYVRSRPFVRVFLPITRHTQWRDTRALLPVYLCQSNKYSWLGYSGLSSIRLRCKVHYCCVPVQAGGQNGVKVGKEIVFLFVSAI